MRVILGLFGAVALAVLSFSAYAQTPPQGTYLQSCRDVRMQGTTLVAVCRRADGRGEGKQLGVWRIASAISVTTMAPCNATVGSPRRPGPSHRDKAQHRRIRDPDTHPRPATATGRIAGGAKGIPRLAMAGVRDGAKPRNTGYIVNGWEVSNENSAIACTTRRRVTSESGWRIVSARCTRNESSAGGADPRRRGQVR